MAVPRNRLSNSRKNTRRAHSARKPKQLTGCSNCSSPIETHSVCSSCGFYRGRQVVVKEKAE